MEFTSVKEFCKIKKKKVMFTTKRLLKSASQRHVGVSLLLGKQYSNNTTTNTPISTQEPKVDPNLQSILSKLIQNKNQFSQKHKELLKELDYFNQSNSTLKNTEILLKDLFYYKYVKPYIMRHPIYFVLSMIIFLLTLLITIINYWFKPPPFVQSSIRVLRSFYILATIILDYKWSLWNLERDTEQFQTAQHLVHERSAQRLLHLAMKNRGVFIKAAQFVASLNHILPLEYTEGLAPTLDQATKSEYALIEQLFLDELQKPISSYFSSFDKVPIAAASLAQVHRATLHNGQKVAVKIQHPGLQEQCKGDTHVLQQLISTAEFFFKDLRLQWLVDEFKLNLPFELDFLNEARNSERLTEVLRPHFSEDQVYIPKIHWDVTTKRIITMEFIDNAFKINDLEQMKKHKIPVEKVCTLISQVFAQQIFLNGFVHCDPHHGNILCRPSKSGFQIVILDHGLYQSLDNFIKLEYSKLWSSIVFRDEQMIKKVANKLGIMQYELFSMLLTSRNYDLNDVGMNSKMSKEDYEKLRQYGQDNFAAITQVLGQVNRKILLLLKANDLLRSIQMALGIPVNYFIEFTKYATKNWYLNDLMEKPSLWNYCKYSIKWNWFLIKIWIMQFFIK